MRPLKIVSSKDVGELGRLFLGRFGTSPNKVVEFVDTIEPGIPREEKWVLMISTQFGCPVGCLMCDAGGHGFYGNLSAEQMLDQIDHVAASRPELRLAAHPKFKIHFARMGEPALNSEVTRALELLAVKYPFPGVMPSISTVAPAGGHSSAFFEDLLRVKNKHFAGGKFQLQFSLHGLLDHERDRVVPISKWSLKKIAQYGERFMRDGDRKVTLNFAVAPGIRIFPGVVSRIFSPDSFLIKITPVNATERSVLSKTANPWRGLPADIQSDADGLHQKGYQVIVSPSAQEEIDAETSCGQLWALRAKSKDDGTTRRGYAETVP